MLVSVQPKRLLTTENQAPILRKPKWIRPKSDAAPAYIEPKRSQAAETQKLKSKEPKLPIPKPWYESKK